MVSGAVRGPGELAQSPAAPRDSLFLVQGAVSLWAFSDEVPESIGVGRGYLADVITPEFVSGPIVATRSKWDYAVGKFYPLAVGIAGQFLLGDDLPKYGGIGTFGIQGVKGAVELPALERGSRTDAAFARHTVYNIDASAVIAKLEGASGAHNDLAHSELSWLGWNAALSQAGDALEAETPQLLRVALPFLGDPDVQLQEHVRADERLDPRARPDADVAQPGALVADDDRLLAVALDDDVRGMSVIDPVSRSAMSSIVRRSSAAARRAHPRVPPRG